MGIPDGVAVGDVGMDEGVPLGSSDGKAVGPFEGFDDGTEDGSAVERNG